MAAADDFLRMLSSAHRGGQGLLQWGQTHGPANELNKLLAKLDRKVVHTPTLPVGHRPAVPDVLWTEDQVLHLRNALNHAADRRQWNSGDFARAKSYR